MCSPIPCFWPLHCGCTCSRPWLAAPNIPQYSGPYAAEISVGIVVLVGLLGLIISLWLVSRDYRLHRSRVTRAKKQVRSSEGTQHVIYPGSLTLAEKHALARMAREAIGEYNVRIGVIDDNRQ